ncbi:MAG: TIGR04282 family arsenosugar biosynthesis glycosyltransferase [Desulfamplus sp.]|nr:TIGR04282 family arsenosugar biosynthesis glycosyltransferase [Desulfamplus sp.]
MKKECIIFYVKVPKEGLVKTRLANDIGSFHALNLYRCFILDLIQTLKKLSQDIIISYSPNNQDTELFFRNWLGDKFYYKAQSDGDLGVRMRQSFEEVFKVGYEKALLIGSDSPDLPKEIFEQAFLKLKTSDAVIGTANDGGYWLIGFSSAGFCHQAFEGVLWSSESVFEDTMEKLRLNNRHVELMPEWIDIDTSADLLQWFESQKNYENRKSCENQQWCDSQKWCENPNSQNNLSISTSHTLAYILSNSYLKLKLLR